MTSISNISLEEMEIKFDKDNHDFVFFEENNQITVATTTDAGGGGGGGA